MEEFLKRKKKTVRTLNKLLGIQKKRWIGAAGHSNGQTGAFDCRQSFLGPNPSYLLYFWDVLDKTDLFNTTMNRLSDEVSVSSPNQVPAVILTGRNSSKADDSEDVSSFISSFRQVIVEVSKEASIATQEVSKEATLAAD
jgi:hypothetical protein